MATMDLTDPLVQWKQAKARLDEAKGRADRYERDAEELRARGIPELAAAEKEAWAKVLALRGEG